MQPILVGLEAESTIAVVVQTLPCGRGLAGKALFANWRCCRGRRKANWQYSKHEVTREKGAWCELLQLVRSSELEFQQLQSPAEQPY